MTSSRSLRTGWRYLGTLVIALFCCSCRNPDADGVSQSGGQQPRMSTDLENTPEAKQEQRFLELRAKMVATQIAGRGISDSRVLEAMRKVPRHLFTPPESRSTAYSDCPLPIGFGQTISQPYIVALTTELVEPKPKAKALDIGTGSGYQAAILAELVQSVYSIEIVDELASEARQRLADLGYENVHIRSGDGYRGWPDQAPFDIITVAAAPDHVPQPLVEQLAPGGRMVIPVGSFYQDLLVIEKSDRGVVTQRSVSPVAFVPMTGEAQK